MIDPEYDCGHGKDINECETCNPRPKCKHGIDPEDCEPCIDREDREWQALCDADEPRYCKHDIPEQECLDCGAEMDALADKARESAEWNHFHPAE
jgi:hypothetical protein